MERITFEDIKDKLPKHHWDRGYKDKLVKKFLSLPEEKKEAMRKRRMAYLERKHRLPNENNLSVKRNTDIMKCSPYNCSCMSPSEYHQYMQQDRYMERAKLAIKEFNIHNHSDFEVVTVESLKTLGSSILYHQMTFTARDAKDPTAASLTFETEVTEDYKNQAKLLYCKCKESGLVVEGKNMSED
ncbi:hypothetical protein OROGR_004032 [Orobanche gracilis]